MPFSSVSPKRSSSGLQHLRDARLVARAAPDTRRPSARSRSVDQLVEERLLLAELVAVADRAADDPAQHVAAAFVAGNDAVDDQERARADVVGDDLERRVVEVGRVPVSRAAALISVLEQVDLVVRVHVLQHRGEALEAHAGVDATAWAAACSSPLVVAVELHEHEVPDLDVAVAVGVGRSRRAARDTRGRGRRRSRSTGRTDRCRPSARSCRSRTCAPLLSPMRMQRSAGTPISLRPDVVGLVVVDVDGDPQLVRRQPVHACVSSSHA